MNYEDVTIRRCFAAGVYAWTDEIRASEWFQIMLDVVEGEGLTTFDEETDTASIAHWEDVVPEGYAVWAWAVGKLRPVREGGLAQSLVWMVTPDDLPLNDEGDRGRLESRMICLGEEIRYRTQPTEWLRDSERDPWYAYSRWPRHALRDEIEEAVFDLRMQAGLPDTILLSPTVYAGLIREMAAEPARVRVTHTDGEVEVALGGSSLVLRLDPNCPQTVVYIGETVGDTFHMLTEVDVPVTRSQYVGTVAARPPR